MKRVRLSLRAAAASMLLVATASLPGTGCSCEGDDHEPSGTGSTGQTTASSSSGGGDGGGGGIALSFPDVARACDEDADCIDPALECIRVTEVDSKLGGAPAGGYCTRPCDEDADCGLGNSCWPPATPGTCVLGCTWGQPMLASLEDENGPDKCHGRDDLRCERFGAGGVCLPTCQSDAQCGGLRCDASGACVSSPGSGEPLGTACDPDAIPRACEGSCVPVGSGVGFCSRPCSFAGGPLLDTEDCGGIDAGICAYAEPGSAVGDVAFCTAPCSAHEDCLAQGVLYCFAFPLGDAIDHGFCYHTTECAEAGAPCGAGTFPGSVCTAITSGGLKCLDPTYPPPGTGGGGGTSGGGAGGTGGAGGLAGAGGLGGAGGS